MTTIRGRSRLALCAGIGALALAAAALPAAASVDPSLSASPRAVAPGGALTVKGTSWVVGAGCQPVVTISRREGRTWVTMGRARVRQRDGYSFIRLRTRMPARVPVGPVLLRGRQLCADVPPFVRTTTVRVVAKA